MTVLAGLLAIGMMILSGVIIDTKLHQDEIKQKIRNNQQFEDDCDWFN